MLLLHNDNDDAVPWYQGIELYLALRRNAKEAYLFSYNGEFHGLRRRHNQKDFAVRMKQYFDHFLKDGAPEWRRRAFRISTANSRRNASENRRAHSEADVSVSKSGCHV
jgi:hypothetical protein